MPGLKKKKKERKKNYIPLNVLPKNNNFNQSQR